MNMIKRILQASTLSLVLYSVLLTSTHAASTPSQTKTSSSASQEQEHPSYLFVLQANKATLTPIKDQKSNSTHILSIPLTDQNLKHVLAYSDRPFRIVKYLTAQQLKHVWKSQSTEFKSDPPNAALIAAGMPAEIIVINSYRIHNNALELSLYRISVKKTSLSKAVALDSVAIMIDNSMSTDSIIYSDTSLISAQSDDDYIETFSSSKFTLFSCSNAFDEINPIPIQICNKENVCYTVGSTGEYTECPFPSSINETTGKTSDYTGLCKRVLKNAMTGGTDLIKYVNVFIKDDALMEVVYKIKFKKTLDTQDIKTEKIGLCPAATASVTTAETDCFNVVDGQCVEYKTYIGQCNYGEFDGEDMKYQTTDEHKLHIYGDGKHPRCCQEEDCST